MFPRFWKKVFQLFTLEHDTSCGCVISSVWFISIAQSRLTLLWPHGLQHARPPCPSQTPGVYLNSCPLSQWWHPTISSSVIPFFSCLQSFPASGSFPVSQFFTTGGLSIGVSASASLLPGQIQDWFPLGWTGWISLQSKGLSRVFSNTTVQKHQFFDSNFFYDRGSEVILHHFSSGLLATQVVPAQCGWGLHKGVNIRKWGSLGPSWKTYPQLDAFSVISAGGWG